MGLIPGPGRPHMPQSNWAPRATLLSLCSGAWDPQLPKPTFQKARAHPQQEKPPQQEACTRSNEQPSCRTREGPHITEDPAQPKWTSRSSPRRRSHVWFCDSLVWKPLGPTWTQMGSPAASGLTDLCFPTSLAPLLTPHPGPGTLCAVWELMAWVWVPAQSVTSHVTVAKLLSHRMGVMILPPHSGAGRTRVRVRALVVVVVLIYLDVWAFKGIPWLLRWWRVCLQCRRPGFNPWVGEDPLEKEMAPYSSILAWEILWVEEPSRLQSMGSQRVGHDWELAYLLGFHTSSPSHVACPCRLSFDRGRVKRQNR